MFSVISGPIRWSLRALSDRAPTGIFGKPNVTALATHRTALPAPLYVYIITILTAIYLIVELSFNARLLDVTGGNTSISQVKAIEYWGRGISGAALTLAVWGIIVLPAAQRHKWRIDNTLEVLIITAALSGVVMWQVQSRIVDYFVDNSTGDTRRLAAKLKFVEQNALTGQTEIAGIPLTSTVIASPEGKAFLSLLPFMSSSVDGIEQKIDPGIRALIRARAIPSFGSPDDFFKKAFYSSAEHIGMLYNQYGQGSNLYSDTLSSEAIYQQTTKLWDKYVTELRRQGYTPTTLPPQGWQRAGTYVQDLGIPVGRNWVPYDQDGFAEAVQTAIRSQAEARYTELTTKIAGEVLPKNLSRAAFEAQPSIQLLWHKGLGLPGHAALDSQMGLRPGDFIANVYEPILDMSINVLPSGLNGSNADFQDGGIHGVEGHDAMAALIVPPIALAFSIAGALLHVFKVTNYLGTLVVSWLRSPPKGLFRPLVAATARTPTGLIALAVLLIAFSAFLYPNAVTASPLFGYTTKQMMLKVGPIPTWTCRWIIQAQPFFWPLNERIRTQILQGFTFERFPRRSLR
jgi:hypothetical protein